MVTKEETEVPCLDGKKFKRRMNGCIHSLSSYLEFSVLIYPTVNLLPALLS